MSSTPITQQDKAVLTLCSKKEAKSYNTIYGGGEINLVEKTVAEVQLWQEELRQRIRAGTARGSTAVGRYQMLQAVLKKKLKNLRLI